ncbi:hypothetical protein E8E14_011174 [Neopestalotiopsis sp. 37M]|nr:hypothetical protein E8E14_011174 [Neopestalotiopsis sp. 37M]
MSDSESASVNAGDYMYLFYNRDKNNFIDFVKVSDTTRMPNQYRVKIGTGSNATENISPGGHMTAQYLNSNNEDEIHLFYVGKGVKAGKEVPVLKEAVLKGASKIGEPTNWDDKELALNRKNWRLDSKSILCSSLDQNSFPRLFYNAPDDLDEVQLAAYSQLQKGGRDWTTTTLTGISFAT